MILAVDPGAERMGWALFGNDGSYQSSGIWAFPKEDGEKLQDYRLRLEEEATQAFTKFFSDNPGITRLVNEILPAVGGGNFAVAGQSYLVNVALTCLHTVAFTYGAVVNQIGATTIKVRVAGIKTASKAVMRNAVIEQYPELAGRKKDWTKIFDEPDAIGVFIAYTKGK